MGGPLRDRGRPGRGPRDRGRSLTPRPDIRQPVERAVVLYDRDCGFCRWSLAKVLSLDRRRSLRPVALQDPEADVLLKGMNEERRYASAHVVTEDGSVFSGGEAVAPLVRLLPAGAPFSAVARLLALPLDAGYRVVVRYRGALGRRLSPEAKDRATGQIDRHAAEAARR